MGIPKYITNTDELSALLKDGVNMQVNVADSNLQELLSDYMDKLLALLERMAAVDSAQIQRSIGLHSYIPALAFDYELIHAFEEDVYVTGITYSQTGWKVMDCWSLYIGGELLFDGIFTKELGEHKHFNVFYGVQAGTEIKVVHHNNSGNSKQVWFDIDYLEWDPNPYIPPWPPAQLPEPEPEPDIPVNPNIPHGRDWVIIVEWVNGSDIDCCWADASTNEVLMGWGIAQKGDSPNKIFKDRDARGENDSEIWSLEGAYRDKLMWGLGWFHSHGPQDVSITITLYRGDGTIIDILTDITGAMLGINSDVSGQFLCVYEFDLREQDYNNQWKRISRMISN